MVLHQQLETFLLRLYCQLIADGLSEDAAKRHCNAICSESEPAPLKSLAEYQEAWMVCRSIMDLVTYDEDGSEIAAWLTALSHRTFDFEDTYRAEHGCLPLHPCGPGASAIGVLESIMVFGASTAAIAMSIL